MTLNGIIALICVFPPNSIALLANYCTSQWLKIDLYKAICTMSAKYCLPVLVFHFWPKLTHPAARSLCNSWVTCQHSVRSPIWLYHRNTTSPIAITKADYIRYSISKNYWTNPVLRDSTHCKLDVYVHWLQSSRYVKHRSVQCRTIPVLSSIRCKPLGYVWSKDLIGWLVKMGCNACRSKMLMLIKHIVKWAEAARPWRRSLDWSSPHYCSLEC